MRGGGVVRGGGGFRGGNFRGFDRDDRFRGFGFGGFGLGFAYGYGYPYYYGGYYGAPYYDPYYYDPYSYDPYAYGYGPGYDPYGYNSYAPVYSPAPVYNTQPPVVVNQSIGTRPAQPVVNNYNTNPDYYLIAFNDHTIQAALSYNVSDDTIHWTTREHVQKSAPLASVDKLFTQQINRDRRVDVRLP